MAEEADPRQQGEPIVSVENFSAKYQNADAHAITDLDFELRRGEAAALVGHTGAGKSTFLKCLNGLIPNFQRAELSGSLSVLGLAPAEHSVAELAGRVGIVFQEFENQLFSTNVEQEVAFGPENLGIPPDEIRARVAKCLALVGLTGFENREPASLSGGEKQRLAIASVLAMSPELLLLDEPTTDLDPQGRRNIYDTISALRDSGTTVLLVEHQIENLLGFDSIVLMSAGRIASRGEACEICTQSKMLAGAGVRPHQVAVACEKLGLDQVCLDVDEAHDAISERFVLDRDKYESLLKSEAESAPSAQVAVEVKELSHSYEKGQFALRDASLEIREGEFIAVVGRNGSGKTTFVKHLNGLLKPSVGEVLFRGERVRRMKLSEIARHVGYVFQNPDNQIFCETVEQEVEFGPKNLGYSEKDTERLVKGAIETVDLVGKEKSDPFCLTKGERQRVAIASTLSCDPEVIILDEPTTGLDYLQELKVMAMLSRLNSQGKTIVFITHSLWLAPQYARRVVAFANGEIAFDGHVRDFFSLRNQEVVERAGLRPPKIVELSHRFGITALSVSEFTGVLRRKSR